MLTKRHERIEKFRGPDNLKHVYKNKLYKGRFAHDTAYSYSKDLAKRTAQFPFPQSAGGSHMLHFYSIEGGS